MRRLPVACLDIVDVQVRCSGGVCLPRVSASTTAGEGKPSVMTGVGRKPSSPQSSPSVGVHLPRQVRGCSLQEIPWSSPSAGLICFALASAPPCCRGGRLLFLRFLYCFLHVLLSGHVFDYLFLYGLVAVSAR